MLYLFCVLHFLAQFILSFNNTLFWPHNNNVVGNYIENISVCFMWFELVLCNTVRQKQSLRRVRFHLWSNDNDESNIGSKTYLIIELTSGESNQCRRTNIIHLLKYLNTLCESISKDTIEHSSVQIQNREATNTSGLLTKAYNVRLCKTLMEKYWSIERANWTRWWNGKLENLCSCCAVYVIFYSCGGWHTVFYFVLCSASCFVLNCSYVYSSFRSAFFSTIRFNCIHSSNSDYIFIHSSSYHTDETKPITSSKVCRAFGFMLSAIATLLWRGKHVQKSGRLNFFHTSVFDE